MTGGREALIIATGIYEDRELRRMRAPAQDSEALARVLGDPAIGGFDVRQLIDQPGGMVSRAIERFFDKRALDDQLLLHLSCHGVKDDDGQLYFAATDTEKDLLASTGVSAAWLKGRMDRCRARSIVLLLDCCYSGAFVAGAKGDEGVHLKEKFEGKGRAILTASNAIEYSWEGDDLTGRGAPSVFTGAIVEGLETGEADRDLDGVVSVDDLYKYVYKHVLAARKGQTPSIWTMEIEDDLYVARNPHPIKREPATLPAEIQDALRSPLPGVRVGVIEALEALLGGSPGLALAAQQALEGLRDDDSRRVAVAASELLAARRPATQAEPPQNAEEVQEREVREPAEAGDTVAPLTTAEVGTEPHAPDAPVYVVHLMEPGSDPFEVVQVLVSQLNYDQTDAAKAAVSQGGSVMRTHDRVAADSLVEAILAAGGSAEVRPATQAEPPQNLDELGQRDGTTVPTGPEELGRQDAPARQTESRHKQGVGWRERVRGTAAESGTDPVAYPMGITMTGDDGSAAAVLSFEDNVDWFNNEGQRVDAGEGQRFARLAARYSSHEVDDIGLIADAFHLRSDDGRIWDPVEERYSEHELQGRFGELAMPKRKVEGFIFYRLPFGVRVGVVELSGEDGATTFRWSLDSRCESSSPQGRQCLIASGHDEPHDFDQSRTHREKLPKVGNLVCGYTSAQGRLCRLTPGHEGAHHYR